MKKRVLLPVIAIAGLLILLYPMLSNYWNSVTQSRVILDYSGKVAELDGTKSMLESAREYNTRISANRNRFNRSQAELDEYRQLLNLDGSANAIMGFVEIPAIDVRLGIYHGTDASVLQAGLGHLEGTSLPIGGEGTHAAVSGHRGLPSAKLLTDLDALELGDRFSVTVLDERLTYEVDRISIVEPDDLSELSIEAGKDFLTLITCTPYGVNTQRLLVRGVRIEESGAKSVRVTADASRVRFEPVAAVIAAILFVLMYFYILIRYRKRRGG